MTKTVKIIGYLEKAIFHSVLVSGNALNRRRVRFARMCLARLPAQSAILYCINGANGIEPNHVACNEDLEREGFRNFRDLLPDLERHSRTCGRECDAYRGQFPIEAKRAPACPPNERNTETMPRRRASRESKGTLQAFRFNKSKDNDQGRYVNAIAGIVGQRGTWKSLTRKDDPQLELVPV